MRKRVNGLEQLEQKIITVTLHTTWNKAAAVSKRFLLAVSPLELLNSNDYEKKKGTTRSLGLFLKFSQSDQCTFLHFTTIELPSSYSGRYLKADVEIS